MKHLLLTAAAGILAALPTIASAHDPAAPLETTEQIFERDLPNVPGKKFIALEVLYPPGGASPAHTHPASSFIYAYVLSGTIVSAVDEEEPRAYRAGEGWYEIPGAHHRVSRNASKTEPAKLLAIFVLASDERELLTPDDH